MKKPIVEPAPFNGAEEGPAAAPPERFVTVSFRIAELFPVVDRRVKERYLRALIGSRSAWPRGLKELSEASGISPQTIKAWCNEFDIKLPS